ncbi:hypothetical protein SUGI_0550900 [Cryptomeria japonica]|nr:hypothetical protein SUGI_0550900 [Cryptomeria japonica]
MKKSSVAKYAVTFMLVCVLFGKSYAYSAFIMFPQPGCSPGPVMIAEQCGCYAIPSDYKGGYMFDYQGQIAALYNTAACEGTQHTILDETEQDCKPFGWNSVKIVC